MSDAECTTSFGKSGDEYYCEVECHQGINCKADIKYIPTMKIRGFWWIERSHMIDSDILLQKQEVFKNLLAKRRLRLTYGSFAKQVGDTLETEADYAEHYQALHEDRKHFRSVHMSIPSRKDHLKAAHIDDPVRQRLFAFSF